MAPSGGLSGAARRIYVAIDTTDLDAATTLAAGLKGTVGGAKLGKEFFTAHGPEGVRRVSDAGLPVFLDLKFHDIPNTVAGAIRAALPLKPAILNVHASGGSEMMRRAAAAAADAGPAKPLLIAVTVLTSMGPEDLAKTGVAAPPEDQVIRLAQMAQAAGMDGVVCSGREISAIRQVCGHDFKLIVPGIRPVWAASGDQKRIVTPKDAVDLGADVLVIGRPITTAPDPAAAARRIADELP